MNPLIDDPGDPRLFRGAEVLRNFEADYNTSFKQVKTELRTLTARVETLRDELEQLPPEETNIEKIANKRACQAFLKAQLDVNKYILDILNKQAAALNMEDIDQCLSSEQESKHAGFYEQADEILEVLRASIQASLATPESQFKHLIEECVLRLTDEWGTCAASAGGTSGAAVSAVYGMGAFGNYGIFAWLPTWVNHGLWGWRLSVAGGVVGGAVTAIGFVALVAIIDVGCYLHKATFDQDAARMHEELSSAIDTLKESPLPAEELIGLRDKYQRAFVFPLCEASPADRKDGCGLWCLQR